MNISSVNGSYVPGEPGSQKNPDVNAKIQSLEQRLQQLNQEREKAIQHRDEKEKRKLEKQIKEIERQIQELRKQEKEKTKGAASDAPESQKAPHKPSNAPTGIDIYG